MERSTPDPDTDALQATLDNYDRCLDYSVKDDGTITARSGMYPNWRRFQRDLHGPTVNIQGHGYAIEHVHKRKMFYAEMHADDDFDHLMPEFVEYEDKPECCIVTLTPIQNLVREGEKKPEVRA